LVSGPDPAHKRNGAAATTRASSSGRCVFKCTLEVRLGFNLFFFQYWN